MREKRRSRRGDYQVGYGRPPVQARFQKGQSRNPRGRPRSRRKQRVEAIVLEEAYRPVTVREGDKVVKLPALQVVLRSQVALAAKGNGPAQRALLALIQAIESKGRGEEGAGEDEQTRTAEPMSDIDLARRICFILNSANRKQSSQE